MKNIRNNDEFCNKNWEENWENQFADKAAKVFKTLREMGFFKKEDGIRICKIIEKVGIARIDILGNDDFLPIRIEFGGGFATMRKSGLKLFSDLLDNNMNPTKEWISQFISKEGDLTNFVCLN